MQWKEILSSSIVGLSIIVLEEMEMCTPAMDAKQCHSMPVSSLYSMDEQVL